MAKYSINDIQVFIMSHERPRLLLETIDCFLNQTIKGFDLTILDNSIETDVNSYLADYKEKGINVILGNKNEPEDMNNLLKAKSLCSKTWVIAFHDDDLVHPQYMEHVLEAINKVEDTTLVCSLTTLTETPTNDYWGMIQRPEFEVFKNVSYFATAIFKGLPIPFCSVVYKSEYFKKTPIRWELGKIMDRPLMYDCVKSGRVVLLNDFYVQTRTNSIGRDTNTNVNGPFYDQWIELIKIYRKLTGDRVFSKNGRTFLNRATKSLLVTMNPSIYQNMGKKKYVQFAIEAGAISKAGYYMGLPYYYAYIMAKKLLRALK